MVLCPIAIAVGCRKCPVFAVCPVKSVIGDYKPPRESPDAQAAAPKPAVRTAKPRSAKSSHRARTRKSRNKK